MASDTSPLPEENLQPEEPPTLSSTPQAEFSPEMVKSLLRFYNHNLEFAKIQLAQLVESQKAILTKFQVPEEQLSLLLQDPKYLQIETLMRLAPQYIQKVKLIKKNIEKLEARKVNLLDRCQKLEAKRLHDIQALKDSKKQLASFEEKLKATHSEKS